VQEARARKNKFAMTFEVPYGNGACRELEVSSDTPFSSFLDKLSRTMEVRKTLLSVIAYIPSYLPKNPKPIPKLLEDKKSWKKLVESVKAHIKTSRDKNKGKGVVKPFSIQIIDTSGPAGDSKVSTGAGTKKVCRVTRTPNPHVCLDLAHALSGKEGPQSRFHRGRPR
jgi:hypothetical protein